MSDFTEIKTVARDLLVGAGEFCKGFLKGCWAEEMRCQSEAHYNLLMNIENKNHAAGNENVAMVARNLRQYLYGPDALDSGSDTASNPSRSFDM